jgi:hypothetical protein
MRKSAVLRCGYRRIQGELLGLGPTPPQTHKTPNPMRVQGHSDVLRHHMVELRGFEALIV